MHERDFEEWYRSAYDDLRVGVTAIIGDRDVATDAVDEACVRAFERWRRVARMESPNGWAYRVAVNVARRRQSRGRLRRQRELAEHSQSPKVDTESAEASALLGLRDSLGQLPRRQREAAVLCLLLDFTERDAATALGISRTALATHLSRAKSRLREMYGWLPEDTEASKPRHEETRND